MPSGGGSASSTRRERGDDATIAGRLRSTWLYGEGSAGGARGAELQALGGGASPSGQRCAIHRGTLRGVGSGGRRRPTVARLFEPPDFDPNKLMLRLMGGTKAEGPSFPPAPRRYTLTHNDLTGELWLAIGSVYNLKQIGGFYSRLLRDEVLAEWQADAGRPSLHVHCHVSGGAGQWWLAPPALRYKIFRREMPLVLDTLRYAERKFLEKHPDLWSAPVWVHFHSADAAHDMVECWGPLASAKGVEFRAVAKCKLPSYPTMASFPAWHQEQWGGAAGGPGDSCDEDDGQEVWWSATGGEGQGGGTSRSDAGGVGGVEREGPAARGPSEFPADLNGAGGGLRGGVNGSGNGAVNGNGGSSVGVDGSVNGSGGSSVVVVSANGRRATGRVQPGPVRVRTSGSRGGVN